MIMNRKDAKDYVRAHLADYLNFQHGIRDPRSLFRCLNPEHRDGTPSMNIDRKSKGGPYCSCFGCHANYDTFDLVKIDYGISNDGDAFRKAYELFGIDIEEDGTRYTNQRPQRNRSTERAVSAGAQPSTRMHSTQKEVRPAVIPTNTHYAQEPHVVYDDNEAPIVDFTDDLEAAHRYLLKNPAAMEHLTNRGISMKTIEAYHIGYAPGGYNDLLKSHPENHSGSRKAHLYNYVFPYPDKDGKMTYFLTEISDRDQIDEWNGKYRKVKQNETGIAAQIFNERYLSEKAPGVIYICEGIYDALAVEEVGGRAMALCGTGTNRLSAFCHERKMDVAFVLSLDNDGSGNAASEKLEAVFKELGIPYISRTSLKGKDFNDFLVADRAEFARFIANTTADAEAERLRIRDAEKLQYKAESVGAFMPDFIDQMNERRHAKCYKTGFKTVDALLGGGLYAGLYICGAISSLGKTTMCLQIIDQIAAGGDDCLVFSLEMAKSELISKSLSRHSLLEDRKLYNSTAHAKTTRDIMNGLAGEGGKEAQEVFYNGLFAYTEYAERIYIFEGVGSIGVDQIRSAVERHIRITGRRPVVLVDYMQILAPYSDRMSDKQNTDKSVLELKRISRDYDIPILGISSFNRSNYTEPVSMASFKESGTIEYSADALIGLQYRGMDYQDDESDKERAKRIRSLIKEMESNGKRGLPVPIQFKVLKYRNGSKGYTLLSYFPKFNCFLSDQAAENAQPDDDDDDYWEPDDGEDE